MYEVNNVIDVETPRATNSQLIPARRWRGRRPSGRPLEQGSAKLDGAAGGRQ